MKLLPIKPAPPVIKIFFKKLTFLFFAALSLGCLRGSLQKSHFGRFHYLASCDFFCTTHEFSSRYNALSSFVQKIHALREFLFFPFSIFCIYFALSFLVQIPTILYFLSFKTNLVHFFSTIIQKNSLFA